MDARKLLFHAALVATLIVGLWQSYGAWLLSRLGHGA
jgi:hypothetical protein